MFLPNKHQIDIDNFFLYVRTDNLATSPISTISNVTSPRRQTRTRRSANRHRLDSSRLDENAVDSFQQENNNFNRNFVGAVRKEFTDTSQTFDDYQEDHGDCLEDLPDGNGSECMKTTADPGSQEYAVDLGPNDLTVDASPDPTSDPAEDHTSPTNRLEDQSLPALSSFENEADVVVEEESVLGGVPAPPSPSDLPLPVFPPSPKPTTTTTKPAAEDTNTGQGDNDQDTEEMPEEMPDECEGLGHISNASRPPDSDVVKADTVLDFDAVVASSIGVPDNDDSDAATTNRAFGSEQDVDSKDGDTDEEDTYADQDSNQISNDDFRLLPTGDRDSDDDFLVPPTNHDSDDEFTAPTNNHDSDEDFPAPSIDHDTDDDCLVPPQGANESVAESEANVVPDAQSNVGDAGSFANHSDVTKMDTNFFDLDLDERLSRCGIPTKKEVEELEWFLRLKPGQNKFLASKASDDDRSDLSFILHLSGVEHYSKLVVPAFCNGKIRQCLILYQVDQGPADMVSRQILQVLTQDFSALEPFLRGRLANRLKTNWPCMARKSMSLQKFEITNATPFSLLCRYNSHEDVMQNLKEVWKTNPIPGMYGYIINGNKDIVGQAGETIAKYDTFKTWILKGQGERDLLNDFHQPLELVHEFLETNIPQYDRRGPE